MPVSALPSRIGAGELGEAAFHFIELLKKNHVKIWQILPLNPVGYKTSFNENESNRIAVPKDDQPLEKHIE